ncbi:MAG: ABC transporter permease, partial [Woeseia sp.]
MLLTAIVAAVLAPWLGTVDPQAISPFDRLRRPGAEFWFGGDLVGRDVFSRTIYGARVSLAVGVGVVIGGVSLGLVVGLLSGFVRWVDQILMRVMDGLMAIPSILLA